MNIKKNNSTVCILTAGIGSRMGYYSDIINKALLPVNNRAVISHIIELFNSRSEFIIGLGFKGDQVKNYLKIAHPKINFKFVKIDNFQGKKSGPGFSLIKCKKYLNKKFFFISCDTLLNKQQIENIDFNFNFVGVSNVQDSQKRNNCNFEIKKNKVYAIFDKLNPKNINTKSFIGFCYIKDFKIFWKSLSYELKKNAPIEISSGLKSLVNNNSLYCKTLNWRDIGSFDLYKKLTVIKNNYDFSKKNEFIYFINNKVIKFENDRIKNKNKYNKFLSNKSVFPKNTKVSSQFLYYDYIKGQTFYRINSIKKFSYLLKWFQTKLWIELKNKDHNSILDNSIEFYKLKTLKRINQYLKESKAIDKISSVNNIRVKKINEYIRRIPWNYLFNSKPLFIHGDLQFDNIISYKKHC